MNIRPASASLGDAPKAAYRRRTMRWTWGTITALLLALAPSASAQQAPQKEAPAAEALPTKMRLDYRRGPGAERCVGEPAFRAALTKRGIGYLLDPEAPARLVVTIKRAGRDYVGSAELLDTHDAVLWKTELLSDWNCAVVVQAITLLISIWLDPPPPPPEECPKPPPAEECPKPPPATAAAPISCPESPYSVWPREPPMPAELKPPKLPERWPFAVQLGAAVWPELIVTGAGSFGFSAEAGVRYRAFSAGIEAHGDPPLGSVTYPKVGPVSFARVSGALLLCAHVGWFAGCGVGDVGRFVFPDHSHKFPASTFYGAAGVRTGLQVPVAPPRLFVTAALDLRAPIHPARYAFGGVTLFEAAGPSFGLGFGLLAEFGP
jgi:hypothetical protein